MTRPPTHSLDHYAAFAPLLRGVLWPGSSDFVPARGTLRLHAATEAAERVLQMNAVPRGDDEAVRAVFAEALARWRGESGTGIPEAVSVGGLSVACVSGDTAGGRTLAGSVAIVTGAAGAIGAGVCETLLAEGSCVAMTDIDQTRLDAMAGELQNRFPAQVHAVAADITDPDSVGAVFENVAQQWGGVDIVVANAGIAHVSPLVELDTRAFRKLERVNVEGTLHTLAEAGRLMKRQGSGGDIVLVSTKNVFAPGAGFGAYSATKAAAHQLARIASLELAPIGVRVNMVAPDAVFSHGDVRSGLWATVGPDRMKARGLDEKGLEEYYRGRNLLKARVEARHVGRAVLFFVTRQTPTTGATIPVDGGLPDATPR